MVRTGHGTTDWFQIGKRVRQGCLLSPCLLTYMESMSCEMPGCWMKHKLESRFPEEISITQIHIWHHPYGRKQRRTEKLLDESERGEWKVGLKLSMQKNKIMASGPIISWKIDGETMETVRDFMFSVFQNHCRCDCSHEIKRCYSLEEKLWPT